MAELTVFGYRSGAGLLHALDIRVKLASLVVISLTSLNMGPLGLCLLSLGLYGLMHSVRISFSAMFRELRLFLAFLVMILLTRGCVLSGSSAPGFFAVSVSGDGFLAGVLICWRLLVVVFLGALLVGTTRSHEVKAGVEWILKPVPMIPAKRTAVMIALVMRFVPLIINQAHDTADAQRARGIENRKNPIYRMIKLTIPLFQRTFQDADKLVSAMEARCYSEIRTDPGLSAAGRDWMALSVVIASCLFLTIL